MTRQVRLLSDTEVKCFVLFAELAPSFREYPHLVFKPFPELVDAVADATGGPAGAWPLGPPCLRDGRLEIGNDQPFSEWGSPYNQDELRYLCRGGGDFYALVNAFLDESILREALRDDIFSISNGKWPSVPQFLERLEWLALPTEHFTDIVFVCRQDKAHWITRLQEWAARIGQEWSQIVGGENAIETTGYLANWCVHPDLKATIDQFLEGKTNPRSWPIARRR